MTPEIILAEATRLGVRLFAKDGGSLGFDAPAGSLTPELKAALVESKAKILALLSPSTPSWRPLDLPWRSVVGGWPDERRERWGRLANDLAEAGMPWPEDEAEAFRQISQFAGGRSQIAPFTQRRQRTADCQAWMFDEALTLSMAEMR